MDKRYERKKMKGKGMGRKKDQKKSDEKNGGLWTRLTR
jgi:hypothetical protein